MTLVIKNDWKSAKNSLKTQEKTFPKISIEKTVLSSYDHKKRRKNSCPVKAVQISKNFPNLSDTDNSSDHERKNNRSRFI